MQLDQLNWLVPIATVAIVNVGIAVFVYVATDVPETWKGSRLVYAVSATAFMAPCFAIVPATAQWLGHGDLFGLLVLVASLAIILACVLTRRRLDGREHAGFWDWLDLDL